MEWSGVESGVSEFLEFPEFIEPFAQPFTPLLLSSLKDERVPISAHDDRSPGACIRVSGPGLGSLRRFSIPRFFPGGHGGMVRRDAC